MITHTVIALDIWKCVLVSCVVYLVTAEAVRWGFYR